MVLQNHVGMAEAGDARARVAHAVHNTGASLVSAVKRVAAEVSVCVYVSRNKAFASFHTPVPPGAKGHDDGATYEKKVRLWV